MSPADAVLRRAWRTPGGVAAVEAPAALLLPILEIYGDFSPADAAEEADAEVVWREGVLSRQRPREEAAARVQADIPLDMAAAALAAAVQQEALSLAARTHDLLHGSAVVWDGRAAMIVGAAGGGKTTLARELVGLGAARLAEGHVPVERASGLIAPYPRAWALTDPAAPLGGKRTQRDDAPVCAEARPPVLIVLLDEPFPGARPQRVTLYAPPAIVDPLAEFLQEAELEAAPVAEAPGQVRFAFTPSAGRSLHDLRELIARGGLTVLSWRVEPLHEPDRAAPLNLERLGAGSAVLALAANRLPGPGPALPAWARGAPTWRMTGGSPRERAEAVVRLLREGADDAAR